MDFTTSTAPWFFVAGLAGCFTLLGALITFAGGYFSDRRRMKREDIRQWDKEVRSLVAEGIRILKENFDNSSFGPDDPSANDKLKAYLANLDRAYQILYELDLLSTDEVLLGYQKLLALSIKREKAAPIGAEANEQAFYDFINAQREFLATVRKTLRIKRKKNKKLPDRIGKLWVVSVDD